MMVYTFRCPTKTRKLSQPILLAASVNLHSVQALDLRMSFSESELVGDPMRKYGFGFELATTFSKGTSPSLEVTRPIKVCMLRLLLV